mgnify:CR=1 FL=1
MRRNIQKMFDFKEILVYYILGKFLRQLLRKAVYVMVALKEYEKCICRFTEARPQDT